MMWFGMQIPNCCFVYCLLFIVFVFAFSLQIYHHLPVSNFVSDFDETVSRSDLKLAVINLIDSEVCIEKRWVFFAEIPLLQQVLNCRKMIQIQHGNSLLLFNVIITGELQAPPHHHPPRLSTLHPEAKILNKCLIAYSRKYIMV